MAARSADIFIHKLIRAFKAPRTPLDQTCARLEFLTDLLLYDAVRNCRRPTNAYCAARPENRA